MGGQAGILCGPLTKSFLDTGVQIVEFVGLLPGHELAEGVLLVREIDLVDHPFHAPRVFHEVVEDGPQRNSCRITSGQHVVDVPHSNDPVGDQVGILLLRLVAPGEKVSVTRAPGVGSGHAFFHSVDGEFHDGMSGSKGQVERVLGQELVDGRDLANLGIGE